ncbi:hypothetical protein Tco_1331845 [Tanacetum coccineum]
MVLRINPMHPLVGFMTTENKHPRGVILQTARTLFVYKNPNAPCWRERRGDGDGGDVMVASVGRQPEEGAARGGEWGSGLGRSEEEEHILKLTGKLRRRRRGGGRNVGRRR